MRRSWWIAADLCRDALTSGSFVVLSLFVGLWLPLQSGLIDGLDARAGPAVARLVPALRRSLVMNASWPALAVLGLHAQLLLPRRLKREIEPLLAAPVTDLEVVAGPVLPVAVALTAGPPITFLLNMAGYWIAAGALPEAPMADLWWLCLATPVACVWLTAFSIDASFKAASQGSYVARLGAGYLLLSALDTALYGLQFGGHPGLRDSVLLAALAAGAAGVWIVSRRLDREALIRRI